MSAPRRPGVPNAQPSAPPAVVAQPVAAEERAGQVALKATGVSFEQTAAGFLDVGGKIFVVESDPVSIPTLEQALADLEAAGMSLIATGATPIKRLRTLDAEVSLLMRRLMRAAGVDDAGDAFDADNRDAEVALIRSFNTATDSDPYDLAKGAEAAVDDGWTDPYKGAAPDDGYGDEPIRGLDLRSRARPEPDPVIMVKPAVPAATAEEIAARAELLRQAGDDPYLAAAIEDGRATPTAERDGAARQRDLEARVSALKAKRSSK